MDVPDDRNTGRLAHLEKLFLIAQFYARDADAAARLVDRVYLEATTNPASGSDLSSMVERLVILSRSDSPVSGDPFGNRRDAQTVRVHEADRYLDSECRLHFLALSPDEKLALWHAVETGSEPGVLVDSDALGSFVRRVGDTLSESEQLVFGEFINRSTVSGALRRFWSSAFVPVPPTLRSVVESKDGGSANQISHPASTAVPRKERDKQSRRFHRAVIYTWVVVLVTAVGYLLTRVGEPVPPSTDMLELSLSAASDVELSFRTDNAEQAERFIQDRFGWRLTLPEITEASLEGISLVSLLDSVQLPVLVFSDLRDNSTVPVFAFSYSFLEANTDRFRLSRETLRQIQQASQFDVHQFRDKTAIIWRHRDDIFTAIVPGSDGAFQSRILVRS